MIRVVSGFMNDPIATSSGAVSQDTCYHISTVGLYCRTSRTLDVFRLFHQETRLPSKRSRSIDCRDARDAMPQPSFKLMDVVRAFTSPACMLTENRIHANAEGSVTEKERILNLSTSEPLQSGLIS